MNIFSIIIFISFENEFIQVTTFNTAVDPGKDNYVEVIADGKIPRDPNFIPPDAVRDGASRLRGFRQNNSAMQAFLRGYPSGQKKLSKFSNIK